jgi:hypothetical protein
MANTTIFRHALAGEHQNPSLPDSENLCAFASLRLCVKKDIGKTRAVWTFKPANQT